MLRVAGLDAEILAEELAGFTFDPMRIKDELYRRCQRISGHRVIELERLKSVLHVSRPVQGQTETTVGLFKVVDGGKSVCRIPVKLGRSSVSVVEVLDGLQIGDQIVLSDMSQWDTHERLRLE